MNTLDDRMILCRIFLLAWIPYVLTCVIVPQFLLAMVFAITGVLSKNVSSKVYATEDYITSSLLLIAASILVTIIPEQLLSGWTKALVQVIFFALYQFSIFMNFYSFDLEKIVHDTRVDRVVLGIVIRGLSLRIRGETVRFIIKLNKQSKFK